MAVTPEQSRGTPIQTPFRPLQAIVALGAIQALTMIAGLGRTKVLALLLGPEGVGLTGVIDQAVTLITHLGTLSLPLVALKFLSRARQDGPEAFARLYHAVLRLLVAAATVGTAIGIVIAVTRPRLLGAELEPYRLALILALLAAPALALAALLRSVLAATDRNRQAALFALVGAVGLVGSAYVGVRTGGLAGLYAANLVIHVALAAVVVAYLQVVGGVTRRAGPPSTLAVLRQQEGLWRWTGGIHVLTLASPFSYLLARVVVLSSEGAVGAGLFAAAYGVAVAMRVVLNQGNALYLFPMLNQSRPKLERVAVAAEYLRVLVVILLATALAVALFPGEWLRLLYSGRFTPAAGLLGAFLVSEGVLLVAGVYQGLLIGFDDLRGHLAISVAGNATIAAGAAVLVPRFGLAGAAASLIGGQAFLLFATAWRLARAHGAAACTRALGPVVVALLMVGAAAAWVGRWHPSPALRVAGWSMVVGLFFARLTPAERRWLLAPWRSDR